MRKEEKKGKGGRRAQLLDTRWNPNEQFAREQEGGWQKCCRVSLCFLTAMGSEGEYLQDREYVRR